MDRTLLQRSKRSRTLICQSCEEEVIEKNIVDFGCIHIFCKSCVKAVLTYQIRRGKLNQLKCLKPTCCIVANKALVLSIVNKETFQLYTNLVSTGDVYPTENDAIDNDKVLLNTSCSLTKLTLHSSSFYKN